MSNRVKQYLGIVAFAIISLIVYKMIEDFSGVIFVILLYILLVPAYMIFKLDQEEAKIINLNEQLREKIDRYIITSTTNLSGKIINVSHAFCEISGYSKDELLGKSHNIVRHPDMSSSVFRDLWETIQFGRTWRGEVKNLKKDGSFYWVDAIIEPDKDENGEIVSYTAIRQDITAKKALEELNKQS